MRGQTRRLSASQLNTWDAHRHPRTQVQDRSSTSRACRRTQRTSHKQDPKYKAEYLKSKDSSAIRNTTSETFTSWDLTPRACPKCRITHTIYIYNIYILYIINKCYTFIIVLIYRFPTLSDTPQGAHNIDSEGGGEGGDHLLW